MCPVCWAAALAAFGVSFAVGAVLVAAKDPAVVLGGSILGVTGVLHRTTGEVFLPWQWYAGVAIVVTLRIIRCAFRDRDRLLPVVAWRRARTYAKTRWCPRRTADGSPVCPFEQPVA
jgi:hypothetical protein